MSPPFLDDARNYQKGSVADCKNMCMNSDQPNKADFEFAALFDGGQCKCITSDAAMSTSAPNLEVDSSFCGMTCENTDEACGGQYQIGQAARHVSIYKLPQPELDWIVLEIRHADPYLTICEVEAFSEDEKLQFSSASQSSTYPGPFEAYRAIDGCKNTQNTVAASGCCAHTNGPSSGSWWKAMLSVPVGKAVTKLALYNRDGMEFRLAGADIYVDGRHVAKVPSDHKTKYELSLFNTVVVEIRHADPYLTICEVEAFSEDEKLQFSSASQSSTYPGPFEAYRAIDGCKNTQNNVAASGCCAHTNGPSSGSWWKAMLSVPVGKAVTKLALYNRDGMEFRLAGADIYVDGRHVAKVPSDHKTKYELSLFNTVVVEIRHADPYLTICEVEAFSEDEKLQFSSASQSSTYPGPFEAYRAIDGCKNTQNNVAASGCCAHTNGPSSGSWWKAMLSVPVGKAVTKLALYNRDGMEFRLAGADIYVDGRHVAKVPSDHKTKYELSLFNTVVVEIRHADPYLTICEVEAFSEDEKLQFSSASQSSTYPGPFEAYRAIDGCKNTQNNVAASGCCAHTNGPSSGSWWKAMLSVPVGKAVTKLALYNRDRMEFRLAGAVVYFDGKPVAHVPVAHQLKYELLLFNQV